MTKTAKRSSRLRMEARARRPFKIQMGGGIHYVPKHLQRKNGTGPLRNVAHVLAAAMAAMNGAAGSPVRKSQGRGA